ncbi:ATPase [Spirochaetia bacterium]|nr:ATPase [Spirochaetia bacterium]
MSDLIQRPQYLNTLLEFKDKDIVKIVTGIRRAGKSTLFRLFQEKLMAGGIPPEQIININLEDAANSEFLDWRKLHDHILNCLIAGKQNYIFLDEIQNVDNFENAINSLNLKSNVDLYLTGSNSRLSSGEIGTSLGGRFVEIKMQPLSFLEYVSAYPSERTPDDKFGDYLHNSSFPFTMQFTNRSEQIRIFLDGLYTSIVQRDIMKRNEVSVKDLPKLESVIKFVFDNIGKEMSILNIRNTIKSDGRVIQTTDIDAYISALIKSFALYKTNRYDVKGKQLLQTNAKYYVADIGLRYFLLGKEGDDGRILENIVYLELIRRGYNVFVGKVNDREVDFVAILNGETEYYQVSQSVLDENTLTRELAPLDAIHDHNQKFLLTRDYNNVSYNGIKHKNVLKWLLGQK